MGRWTRKYPRAAAVFFAVCALIAATYAVLGFSGLAQGRGSAAHVAISVFWVFALVVILFGLRRAVRDIRDQGGPDKSSP